MSIKTVPPKHTRKAALFQLLLEIPDGKAATYASLARKLATSPRAVAAMLASNHEQDRYPCYRVVRSDGRAGGYNLGTDEKIRRLEADGIRVTEGFVSKEATIF